jgi:hypothetical protein
MVELKSSSNTVISGCKNISQILVLNGIPFANKGKDRHLYDPSVFQKP